MNKYKIILIIAISLVYHGLIYAQEVNHSGPSIDFSHGKLIVSENNRFLQHEDGTPFFYLGCTAWELFHRLDEVEARKYLENRRKKGFTVIQAVILAELYGLETPNANGDLPLIDKDPTKPNENYFKWVDKVIRIAEEKGLYIGLLPTWGDKVDKRWGVGPVVFNPKNAFEYGLYLGERYRAFKNIIWINGGDRSGGDGNEEVWQALANGIKSVDKNHLMTFHPWGGNSSSKYFHNEKWLDFNMMQTGHCDRSYDPYIRILKADYDLLPTKPTFDGEPSYEDHPVCWNPEILGWHDDADVRKDAYWNLFTGGFGHTYGCHPIWQMHAPGREPVGGVRNYWYDVLDLPGAWDMIHVRRLMESRPMLDREPAQEILDNGFVPEKNYIVATRGKNYVMIYIPSGTETTILLDKLGWNYSVAWWYNPKNGKTQLLEEFENKGNRTFKPEKDGRGNDIILVIDNKDTNFDIPGIIN